MPPAIIPVTAQTPHGDDPVFQVRQLQFPGASLEAIFLCHFSIFPLHYARDLSTQQVHSDGR